ETPVLVGDLRRRHRALDVLGSGLRKGADQLAVGRAGRVERVSGGGIDPLAADEVLERLRDRGHLRTLALLRCAKEGPLWPTASAAASGISAGESLALASSRPCGLTSDVGDDAVALVELRVPGRERGLDLGQVRAAVGEPDRLGRLRHDAV